MSGLDGSLITDLIRSSTGLPVKDEIRSEVAKAVSVNTYSVIREEAVACNSTLSEPNVNTKVKETLESVLEALAKVAKEHAK